MTGDGLVVRLLGWLQRGYRVQLRTSNNSNYYFCCASTVFSMGFRIFYKFGAKIIGQWSIIDIYS